MIKRLTRSRTDRRLAGVCGGIAEYLDADSTVVRLVWLVFSIFPGCVIGGVLAYLLAWLVMPEGSGGDVPVVSSRRLTRSVADRKIAGVCGGLAAFLQVDATPLRLLWVLLSVLPGAIIGGVALYLAAWLIIPAEPVALMAPTPGPNPANGNA
jgi:phage shock protein PspC (stress-responsive transcriptional regulator)